MEQRPLGRTGLHVSRLALGTMTWGRDTDEDDAAAQLRAFVDAGGTLVDTADVYSHGDSERVVGRLLQSLVERSDVVLATKAVNGGPRTGGRSGHRRADASRKNLLDSLDASLQRLQVDTIDLWQLHTWDRFTPLEESLAALDTAVASGRVRYAGISNYSGWQTAKAATCQQTRGAAPLASTQMEYSLLQRGIEREVLPAAADLGLGVLAWSPLGRGVLTGKYRGGRPADSRANTERYAGFVEPYLDEASSSVVGAVVTAADGLGVSPVAVALSWVRDRPGVTAPIVGARTAAQLRASLAAEELVLPQEIRAALDDVSLPAAGYPERMP
jgi:aryl-alcohol dehydrogenase-like predicted oxidoreductase